MQKFIYTGSTICYERLPYDATPIGLAMQVDGILVLVCRHPEAAEEDLLLLYEVQVCSDCHTLQRHDGHVEACLMCGGALEWAEVWHESVGG